MKSFSEQYREFTELQRKSMTPMQQFSGVAVDAFERIVRKHYDVAGDVVEFTIGQAQLPVGVLDPQEIVKHQAAGIRAFAERVNRRAGEYVTIAEEIGGAMRSDIKLDEFVESAQAVAESSLESVSETVTETVDQADALLTETVENAQAAEGALARASRLATTPVQAAAEVTKNAKDEPARASKPAARASASKTSRPAASKAAGKKRAASGTGKSAAAKASTTSATGNGTGKVAKKRASTARKKQAA